MSSSKNSPRCAQRFGDWEIWRDLMAQQWDEEIKGRLGNPIPSEANPSADYRGPLLVRVMPNRTQLYHGKPLELRAIAMGDPFQVQLHWRPLGQTKFQAVPCAHIARGVYRVHLPPQTQDFEFYVEARTKQERAAFPPTAPDLNRAIVVSGRMQGGNKVTGAYAPPSKAILADEDLHCMVLFREIWIKRETHLNPRGVSVGPVPVLRARPRSFS